MYKYNLPVWKAILEILSKKSKEDVLGFNELCKRLDNLIHTPKDAPKKNLNRTNYSKILKSLENKRLIKVEKGKIKQGNRPKNDYSLSEIGLLCYKQNYELEEIDKFAKISHMICAAALFGSSEKKERRLDLGEKPQAGDLFEPDKFPPSPDENKRTFGKFYYYDNYKKGVSKKDILERRYNNKQANFLRLSISKNEIDEYFGLLIEKKVLRIPAYEDKEERYVLFDEPTGNFISKCWGNLYNDIYCRIEIKMNYLYKKMKKIEKDWCIKHLGRRRTDLMISNWYEIYNKRKKEKDTAIVDPDSERYYDSRIKMYNENIVKEYGELYSQLEKVFRNLPHFEILALDLICPEELLDMIKEENEIMT